MVTPPQLNKLNFGISTQADRPDAPGGQPFQLMNQSGPNQDHLQKEETAFSIEAGESKVHDYDPHFTDRVIEATGPNAHPRLAQMMPSLLRYLHDFATDVDLTVAEWAAGVELVSHQSPQRSA